MWTVPFIERQDRSCWRNAARSAAVGLAKPKQHEHIVCHVGMSFIRRDRSGAVDMRVRRYCWQAAIKTAWRIASELNCKTVAFPSISTGVYRFPLNRAAEIAIRTIEEYLSTHAEIEQVSMICFDGTTLSAYQNALSEWEANHV